MELKDTGKGCSELPLYTHTETHSHKHTSMCPSMQHTLLAAVFVCAQTSRKKKLLVTEVPSSIV